MSDLKPPYKLNTILYGPPGTGKTYNVISWAVAIIMQKPLEEIKEARKQKKRLPEENGGKTVEEWFKHYKDVGQIEFVTFHQNYSYEDFIEGIKPKTTENGQLSFEVKDGVLKKFAKLILGEDRLLHPYDQFLRAYSKLGDSKNLKTVVTQGTPTPFDLKKGMTKLILTSYAVSLGCKRVVLFYPALYKES